MKTKRNKKQKNRSFRKNRSFKKKGLKKNPTRKNVGGHLMGFEVGAGFTQPLDNFIGGIHDGVTFFFKAHTFKHIDTFSGETYPEHDSIAYPICRMNATGDVDNCPLPISIYANADNLPMYNRLAVKMFDYMNVFLDMDTVTDWVKGTAKYITGQKLMHTEDNNEREDKFNKFNINRKWFEIPLSDAFRKIHLVIERVSSTQAIVWELSQKYNSNRYYATGETYVYPTAKFNLKVNNESSNTPINVITGTPINIKVEILNTVKSYIDGVTIFGIVQIYDTTISIFFAKLLFQYNVTNRNQRFTYNAVGNITSLQISATIGTYYNKKTIKTQNINIIQPLPQNLTNFTFSDATIIVNSPNKNVVGTRDVADNQKIILIEKWRISEKKEEILLHKYILEPDNLSINIEIDPTKPIELRAYAINEDNVKSNDYKAKNYEFDYIKTANVTKAVQNVQGDSTFTLKEDLTYVVDKDLISIYVKYKLINKRLLFFYCYATEKNNGTYVFDSEIEESTFKFQISNPDINNKFVKFLFYMKEGAGNDTTGINKEDLSSYKELIIPLLSANARGENENDVNCVISGNTQNAISAQLNQYGEEKNNQQILENNQTYRFPGLNRGLGDAANLYFVTVNGKDNKRKITLPVSCHALEGEAAQRAEEENARIAAETVQLEVDENTARIAAETALIAEETARLENFCNNCEWKDDKGKVMKLFGSSSLREMKKIVKGDSKVNKKTRWSLEELQKVGVVINNTRRPSEDVKNIFKSLNLNTLDIDTTGPEIILGILKCIKSKVMDPRIEEIQGAP